MVQLAVYSLDTVKWFASICLYKDNTIHWDFYIRRIKSSLFVNLDGVDHEVNDTTCLPACYFNLPWTSYPFAMTIAHGSGVTNVFFDDLTSEWPLIYYGKLLNGTFQWIVNAAWWRHAMENLSPFLTFCDRNPPLTGRSRSVTTMTSVGDAGLERPPICHHILEMESFFIFSIWYWWNGILSHLNGNIWDYLTRLRISVSDFHSRFVYITAPVNMHLRTD